MGQMQNNMRGQSNNDSMQRPMMRPKSMTAMSPMKPRIGEYNYTMPGGTVKTSQRGNPNAEGISEMNPDFMQALMGRFRMNNLGRQNG